MPPGDQAPRPHNSRHGAERTQKPQRPSHGGPTRPLLDKARPDRADEGTGGESGVEQAIGLGVGAVRAVEARGLFFFGLDDVGDLGHERGHDEGEAEAEDREKGAEEGFLGQRVVRDEAEQHEHGEGEDEADGREPARAVFVRGSPDQWGAEGGEDQGEEDQACARGGPAVERWLAFGKVHQLRD